MAKFEKHFRSAQKTQTHELHTRKGGTLISEHKLQQWVRINLETANGHSPNLQVDWKGSFNPQEWVDGKMFAAVMFASRILERNEYRDPPAHTKKSHDAYLQWLFDMAWDRANVPKILSPQELSNVKVPRSKRKRLLLGYLGKLRVVLVEEGKLTRARTSEDVKGCCSCCRQSKAAKLAKDEGKYLKAEAKAQKSVFMMM